MKVKRTNNVKFKPRFIKSVEKQAVADLSNVLAGSDLSSEYLLKSLTADTKSGTNLVSAVFSCEKVVAAVAWTPKRKGLQAIAAAGAGGHATNLVAALETLGVGSWAICCTSVHWR